MISFATVAAAKHYGRLVHVWLPQDADEAHGLLVDLSKGQHRYASATPYDRARFGDIVGEAGGFSHHPTDGPAPHDGWMVSYDGHADQGVSKVHRLQDLTPEHIAEHRQGARHHLKKPNTYQGGWLDRGTGEVYLDVSRHFEEGQEDQAREFALDQRQKAYYHLKDGTEKYLHPQHDPQMLEDHNGWADKYAEHMKVPDRYRSYEHLYPASPALKQHLDERHERLASTARARMVAQRRIP